jgi:hypothetical protein
MKASVSVKATAPTTAKVKPAPAVASKGEVNGVTADKVGFNQNDVDALFD